MAPPSASKHSFHSKQLSPEEAVLDRPAHWASAKKVVKRPPLSSIQASQFNKKPRGKEHLVVAALPPPAPISSSTATSSASSSSRSIKPAWMQRRTAAPLAFAASSSRTARVTEDDIVEDAPDDSHYEPPPHTSSFSGSTSDIHRHQSSRTQAVHPVTQDYVMEKLHVTISPSGKGKSGRATAAKTGSLRWRLMKIHRESESVENWMSTIRLQSHVDHSGFDNPKNRAKHIVECEVIEILDIAQTTPFRVLKVMVLTPSPSANNHEVISPKNLLKDNELDPYEVVEPVSSASSAGAYLSLVLLREGLYPDLLHSLHTGKRIKLFDAQEIILPKDATQQLVVTDNLTRLLGEDLVAISGIASIFLSTYVWEYAS